MREVIVNKSCDWHRTLLTTDGVAANEEAIVIIGGVPRLLDLCGPCAAAIQSLHDSGVEPDVVTPLRPTPVPGRISCPLCPMTASSRTSLGQHVSRAHPGHTIRSLVKEGLLARP